MLVPGMHLKPKFNAWCDILKNRNLFKGGKIESVDNKNMSATIMSKLKVRKEHVPCKRGEVRVSMPHLPHGSTGPASIDRRTMLPWYAFEGNDAGDMESQDTGSWEELAAAHRDMVAPPSTPSGHTNRYGLMVAPFLANCPLDGLGPLSDCLVGRARWSAPRAQMELYKLIFDPTLKTDLRGAKIKAYLAAWRTKAAARIKVVWEEVKEKEKAYYGANSYFAAKERYGAARMWDHRPQGTSTAELAQPAGQTEDERSETVLSMPSDTMEQPSRVQTRTMRTAQKQGWYSEGATIPEDTSEYVDATEE